MDILWLLTVPAGLGAILIAGLFHKPDPLVAFREDCRKEGMSFEEAEAALAIRTAFVRLRRKATTLCHVRGGDIAREHLVELIEHETAMLHATHGFEPAKSFVAWANACPEHEILYPDAHEVRVKHLRSKLTLVKPSRQVIEDMHAAVKVTRR